ncbi:MAG: DUF547 domain-containing protein [Acidimicrobiia bacterium]|nr:DUF547 domain-containing protein [Acidimicrobiia bacterium]
MSGPNPIAVAWSVANVLLRVREPAWRVAPDNLVPVDQAYLAGVLSRLAESGIRALRSGSDDLDVYLSELSEVDPDSLSRDAALAFWINMYNGGALRLAARAGELGAESVLRIPGGFSAPFVHIRGEALSLDGIEHGKIRRFGDPRVHGALVCGSVSCPTLRPTPYTGAGLDQELDDQMRMFMSGGGALRVGDDLAVSRVFKWFGGDFTRPESMPTWVPGSKRNLVRAIQPFLPDDLLAWITASDPRIVYQPYDWGLRCSIG